MIKRHYMQKHLKSNHNQLAALFPSVWDLSPYQIASFGGELTKVMLEAAQRYITAKSVSRQQSLFEAAAFHGKTGR